MDRSHHPRLDRVCSRGEWWEVLSLAGELRRSNGRALGIDSLFSALRGQVGVEAFDAIMDKRKMFISGATSILNRLGEWDHASPQVLALLDLVHAMQSKGGQMEEDRPHHVPPPSSSTSLEVAVASGAQIASKPFPMLHMAPSDSESCRLVMDIVPIILNAFVNKCVDDVRNVLTGYPFAEIPVSRGLFFIDIIKDRQISEFVMCRC